MWSNNELTNILDIQYPIVQAGMAGGVTTPQLAAEVSNNGALGTIGAGYMEAADLKNTIRETKKMTDHPFAVNLFVPEKYEIDESSITESKRLLDPICKELGIESLDYSHESSKLEQHIDLLLQEGISIYSFTFGIPSPNIIARLKNKNCILIGTATTVEEAIMNEHAGMDIVVAQGSEAGGHRGTFSKPFSQAMIGTLSLVPQIVDYVKIPVVAAGGIMDARGIMAARMLGAHGVQMGTAFLTCEESGAKPQHKKAILSSSETDPILTSVFSGKPARGIRNTFISKLTPYEDTLPPYPIQNALTKPIRKAAYVQDKPEYMSLWSGQSPRLSKHITARELINGIITDTDKLLKDL
ncbi:NAD(P)H-dependent flavin oxidoreductase [Thalassobacillus pellis]|uniref:NAD(P)H-dependent flavin oxidoreductase n=1 Tax=Thalassobacillus pellis TaxID=748008 RepID=UPI001EF95275|nr:nitronate monooxygenase [Thalassobacillus pellis]MBM7552600.1 nitronate monooxygenase [Thalassobacillus pellis]